MKHPFDGTWHIEAFGIYLNIHKSKITSYQITDDIIVCYPIINGKIKDSQITTDIADLSLTLDKDTLLLTNTDLCLNLVGLPIQGTLRTVKNKNATPEDMFIIFWHSFNQHYAFFDAFETDWQETYHTYHPQITKAMSTDALFHILCDMVTPLNDDHISLSYKELSFTPYKDTPAWWESETVKALVGIIDNHYISDMTYLASRSIRYGHLSPDIGYINIAIMATDSHIETSVSTASHAFSQAIQALKTTNHLVLDLRFNRGGFDDVSKTLAGFFTSDTQAVYKKESRYGDRYTDIITHTIEPKGDAPYTGSIYLLISGATVSAAEVFCQCITQLKDVTVVGEKTAGFFSDALERVLPGGIGFTLSNERYYTMDDCLLEHKGIHPDVYVPISTNHIANKKDPAIDWILHHTQSNS